MEKNSQPVRAAYEPPRVSLVRVDPVRELMSFCGKVTAGQSAECAASQAGS